MVGMAFAVPDGDAPRLRSRILREGVDLNLQRPPRSRRQNSLIDPRGETAATRLHVEDFNRFVAVIDDDKAMRKRRAGVYFARLDGRLIAMELRSRRPHDQHGDEHTSTW